MGRFVYKQKVIVMATGEIKEVYHRSVNGMVWFMLDASYYKEHEITHIPTFSPWQQNTALDVGAKSPKGPLAADKAARIANRAIERMINQ